MMGICWYCYWGWPKPVSDIYQEALRRLDGDDFPLKFGPSHIVWEDENFDSAEWCLEHFDEHKGDYGDEVLEVVRWSLDELAKLPLEAREVIPDDYDDEHPEQYPPTIEVVHCT